MAGGCSCFSVTIRECCWPPQAVQAAAPRVAELQADTTLCTMLSLLLPHLRLDSQAIKLQVNKGGPF